MPRAEIHFVFIRLDLDYRGLHKILLTRQMLYFHDVMRKNTCSRKILAVSLDKSIKSRHAAR